MRLNIPDNLIFGIAMLISGILTGLLIALLF